MLLSLFAIIFTSRATLFIFVLSNIIYFVRNSNGLARGLALSLSLLGLVYLYNTFNSWGFLLGLAEGSLESYGGYAVYSLDSLFQQIFIWPGDLQGWLFGYYGDRKDSGWSMAIAYYGIILTSMVVTVYYILYKLGRKNGLIFYIILVTFIVNIKNDYLFTRNSFELILIISLILRNDNTTSLRTLWS